MFGRQPRTRSGLEIFVGAVAARWRGVFPPCSIRLEGRGSIRDGWAHGSRAWCPLRLVMVIISPPRECEEQRFRSRQFRRCSPLGSGHTDLGGTRPMRAQSIGKPDAPHDAKTRFGLGKSAPCLRDSRRVLPARKLRSGLWLSPGCGRIEVCCIGAGRAAAACRPGRVVRCFQADAMRRPADSNRASVVHRASMGLPAIGECAPPGPSERQSGWVVIEPALMPCIPTRSARRR